MAAAGSTKISSALLAKLVKSDAVLDHIEPGADLIVGVGNGEPSSTESPSFAVSPSVSAPDA
jgi:hypothetical protein